MKKFVILGLLLVVFVGAMYAQTIVSGNAKWYGPKITIKNGVSYSDVGWWPVVNTQVELTMISNTTPPTYLYAYTYTHPTTGEYSFPVSVIPQ